MTVTTGASSDAAGRLWDPADAAFRADPYPAYAYLRDYAPIYPAPDGPLVVTRYADVARVLRSNEVSRDIEAHARIDPNDAVAARRRERRQGGAKTILNLDPPDHTRLRRLVS
jgi:cytochrome P450